jgi:YD repeat-containing protein
MKPFCRAALIFLFVFGMKSGFAADRTFTYTYSSFGDFVTSDGPRTDVSDVTTFGYDASHWLNSITNALGQVYAITSFDASGRPLTVVDPNGSTTNLTYDSRGRLLTRTTNGHTTAFTTDAVGNVTTVTNPNGLILTYGYDTANRLTSITDNQGNQILYTLDSAGNTTNIEIRDPGNVLAYTQSQTFDELSRLLSQVGGANQVNSFSYDKNSNLVSATDGNDNTTTNAFDGLNRLMSQTDPFSFSDEIVYDSLDQATSITDKNGNSTNYTWDKLGNLSQIQSPDAGTITFTYDAAGNVLTRTDSRPVTISYAYDALNRLVSIQYPDSNLNVNVTYDQGTYGIGHITSIAVGTNKTCNYAYDLNGNLISKTSVIDGISSAFSFQYDGSNDMIQMTYPSGRVVDYTRNDLGRVTDVTVTENGMVTNLVNNIAYEPFGPRSSMVFGNGAPWSAAYDLSYRLTNQTAGGFQDLGYNHDGTDHITAISDILNPPLDKTYAYDSLNQLTDSLMASSFSYTYDPVGNRLAETVNAFTKNYSYQPGSNRIASISPSESFVHDAAGNIVSSSNFHMDYDDLNRIKTVKDTQDHVIANYEYDHQNYRVKKVLAATGITTYYHYGFFGNLLVEQDAQGASVIEYVYLDGAPIAMFY